MKNNAIIFKQGNRQNKDATFLIATMFYIIIVTIFCIMIASYYYNNNNNKTNNDFGNKVKIEKVNKQIKTEQDLQYENFLKDIKNYNILETPAIMKYGIDESSQPEDSEDLGAVNGSLSILYMAVEQDLIDGENKYKNAAK